MLEVVGVNIPVAGSYNSALVRLFLQVGQIRNLTSRKAQNVQVDREVSDLVLMENFH